MLRLGCLGDLLGLEEGLKVPRRQPKRGRLWLNDGSCIRLRPLHKNHVWSYDFVNTRTHDGRPLKLLTVLDESTRQCMAIKVARKIRAHDVLEVEIFYTLPEAVILVEQWRRLYNTVRPHSASGGRPPAPEAIKPSPWFLRMPQLHGPTMAAGLDDYILDAANA